MHSFPAGVDVNNSLCKMERKLDSINKPNSQEEKRKKSTIQTLQMLFPYFYTVSWEKMLKNIDARILEFPLISSTENDKSGWYWTYPSYHKHCKIWTKYTKWLFELIEHQPSRVDTVNTGRHELSPAFTQTLFLELVYGRWCRNPKQGAAVSPG